MKFATLVLALFLISCGGNQGDDPDDIGTSDATSARGASGGGCADVIDVNVERDGQTSDGVTTYRFDVTVQSNDLGWDKYADRWEVVDPTGRVLGERVLTHPHETEQPFTRSQAGIPIDAERVTVRAHDSVDGFCGAGLEVEIS